MPSRTKVFISYSHLDPQYLTELQRHLRPLERAGRIDRWDDSQIQPGMLWQDEIRSAVAATRVAVLFVSPGFLASDFIDAKEWGVLRDAWRRGEVTVLWLLVSPCRHDLLGLGELQAIHDLRNPLASMSPSERDAVWVRLTHVIESELHRPSSGEGTGGAGAKADGAERRRQAKIEAEHDALVRRAYAEGGPALWQRYLAAYPTGPYLSVATRRLAATLPLPALAPQAAAWSAALAANPASGDALLCSGVYSLRLGQFPRAEQFLDRMIAVHPGDADGYYYRAISLFRGRSPALSRLPVARQAEHLANTACQLASQEGRYVYLLAAVRHYYFERNSVGHDGASPRRLLAGLKGQSPNRGDVREICTLLSVNELG